MKTQMKFQKIMCLIMLLMGALSAVYCFMYCSAGLANIGTTLDKSAGQPDWDPVFEPAQRLYYDIQPFNNALLILSIVMILAAVLLYITGTNKRRNYYISNIVATAVVCVIDFVASVYIMVQNGIFLSRFNELMADPAIIEKYQEFAARPDVDFVTSSWNFTLGFFVYALVILACIGLIINLVLKIKLMKGEKELLAGKFVEEVA